MMMISISKNVKIIIIIWGKGVWGNPPSRAWGILPSRAWGILPRRRGTTAKNNQSGRLCRHRTRKIGFQAYRSPELPGRYAPTSEPPRGAGRLCRPGGEPDAAARTGGFAATRSGAAGGTKEREDHVQATARKDRPLRGEDWRAMTAITSTYVINAYNAYTSAES